MQVACESSELLAAQAADVANAVVTTLARGQPSYAYRLTYVSDDRLQFRAMVRATRWLSPFTLLIRLEPEGAGTRITLSTYPPARVDGDVFDFCNSLYFRDLLAGTRQTLGIPVDDSQTRERPPSRWALATIICRTFGWSIVSILICTALAIQFLLFPSSDTRPLLAVFGVLLAARLIRSIVFWTNWWGDPQNAGLPGPRPGKTTGRP